MPKKDKKAKKPRRKYNPPEKQANASKENIKKLDSMDRHGPTWLLEILDIEHQHWGWKNFKNKQLGNLLCTLKNYESMTWNEIFSDKKYNHHVPISDLDKEAQKRLAELKLEDMDELFRFRCGGKERVWGVIDQQQFKVLWWDPKHTVCPANKRHT